MENRTTPRADQYRDLLEVWAAWWNNVGRANFTHYILPPLTATSEALACTACVDVGWYEAQDSPIDRCQVCHRKFA